MNQYLPERISREISTFARKHSVQKVVLFGSRARGDNTERSDIDIAVYGGDFDAFYWDIKEKVHSLLMFDLVEMDNSVSKDLIGEIQRDGVIIYEKALSFICMYYGNNCSTYLYGTYPDRLRSNISENYGS